MAKYEKTALNFMIQAFSTSFYFSKSRNIFTILEKKQLLLHTRTTLQIFTKKYKMELTRTS